MSWYAASYIMTLCATQLLFGKLYTLYPVKTIFLAAIALFELGSVVSGAAPTSNALIAGRAVSGVGGAGVFSGAMVIIPYTVAVKDRPACKYRQKETVAGQSRRRHPDLLARCANHPLYVDR